MTTTGELVVGPGWLVDDLLRVERLLRETAGRSDHPLVSEASLHLLEAGGKRLRPALVMLAARSGEPGRRESDLAAAAVELVHLATLYHDDVIDGTETRRGVPTAHAKWGVNVAVLAGDYLFACGCALGAEAGGEVSAILADAIAEVCEGEIVETTVLGDPHRRVDDYLSVIEQKTAALFRGSCELGAATSAADGSARRALVTYGHNLGLAFQVVDDLLDLTGDPAVTGKTPGTDLKEGVFTAPVLLACEREPELARKLEGGTRDLGEILPILRSTGALDDAHGLARDYGAAARRALDDLPEADWTGVLGTIVQGVLAQAE
ncbi:MAG: polyprenyl synthetase family protein [Actinomycetota bacterium]